MVLLELLGDEGCFADDTLPDANGDFVDAADDGCALELPLEDDGVEWLDFTPDVVAVEPVVDVPDEGAADVRTEILPVGLIRGVPDVPTRIEELALAMLCEELPSEDELTLRDAVLTTLALDAWKLELVPDELPDRLTGLTEIVLLRVPDATLLLAGGDWLEMRIALEIVLLYEETILEVTAVDSTVDERDIVDTDALFVDELEVFRDADEVVSEL